MNEKENIFRMVLKINKTNSWCVERTNRIELVMNLIREGKKISKLETKEGHNYIYEFAN